MLAGVFVRSQSPWGRLRFVTTIAFDKTGTLTKAQLELSNPEVFATLDSECVSILSTLVASSRHPVASSIRERLMAMRRFRIRSFDVVEEIGQGVRLESGGSEWRLGKADWALPIGEGGNVVLSRNGRAIAIFDFEDRLREDVPREIGSLKDQYDLYLLSGDSQEKAARAAKLAGIARDKAFGGMLPDDKANWIRKRHKGSVAMVGDGINDSLAFGEAACSGAPASDMSAMASKADFYYLGSGIAGVGLLLRTGLKRGRAIAALMGFAIAYNALAIGLAVSAAITPLMAAAFMPVSSVASLAIVWIGFRRS